MKHWPVPDSDSRDIPLEGQGSFAEDRGDRHHCGVDIYATRGSNVVSTEEGTAIAKGVFTTPKENPYWFTTYFVAIKHPSGHITKYCELEDVTVEIGDTIQGGQVIGHVGNVLNPDKVGPGSPEYIQRLIRTRIQSMLHFEMYEEEPVVLEDYSGGNWFSGEQPSNLLNPTDYLRSIHPEDS